MATWINICAVCGETLMRNFESADKGVIKVFPCIECSKKEYDNGYKFGVEDTLEKYGLDATDLEKG